MRNIDLIINVAKQLRPLLDKFVFVGGCAVDLLVDDNAAADIRITDDVDVITEVASKYQYYSLIKQIKDLGFKEKIPTGAEPTPICRLICKEMKLDVMPTDESILGFTNRWYIEAINNAQNVELENGLTIKLISPAYFIATKLVAFRTRGKSDFYCHDMEDIITVYNGNENIVNEIKHADNSVRKFIAEEFAELILLPGFKSSCIAGHLSYEDKFRVELVYDRIKQSIL